MIGRDKAIKILDDALANSTVTETEILLVNHDHYLTRFANSQIHQNVAEENSEICIRVVENGKIGVATTNSLHPARIRKTVMQAVECACFQKKIDDFPGLPEKSALEEICDPISRTIEINPEEKALIIGDMIAHCHGDRVSLSGAFYTGMTEIAVANSRGVSAYQCGTMSDLAVIASSKNTSGYAKASARNVDDMDHISIIEEALESSRECDRTIDLDPGKYTVFLEEYAVADLIFYLAYMGLTARSIETDSSFITHNKGEQIVNPEVSIYDDALNNDTFRMAFDYEGVPRRRVDFIKNGIVTGNFTNNNYTAKKFRVNTYGFAMPATWGLSSTMPLNLIMEKGSETTEEIISGMERGLIIKRFHYLTSVHPNKTIVSGMTRDGVFMVENGKVTARVNNMRFTQSILEALKNTVAISNHRKTMWNREFSINMPNGITVPSLLIKDFNFTGKTEF